MTKKAPPHAWGPGVSGNPRGRPKGSRNHTTRIVQALLDHEGEIITRTAIEMAKGGDLAAIKLILDRLTPPLKERPISIDLPDTSSAAGIAAAQAAIVQAVANGELTPGEGQTLAGLVEARRKAIELLDMESRITALEEATRES